MPKRVFGNLSNLHFGQSNKNHANNAGKLKRSAEDSPRNQIKKIRATLGEIGNLKDNAKSGKALESSSLAKENPSELTNTIEAKIRHIDLNLSSDENRGGYSLRRSTLSKSRDKTPGKQALGKKFDFADPNSYYEAPSDLPENVEDFDRTQLKDISTEPQYAQDIFKYYKEQEVTYAVKKYLESQPEINKTMRAVLVDWMVEVQESFELNHETLYLAVKLLDRYLMKEVIQKAQLQLLGATCVLIAAKFDERIPPAIEDFLYICDDAYERNEVVLMEMEILRTLDYFLGFPISYRFLRRYARCAKLSMETLTLSRYILEMSLMEFELVEERDSKVAASSLLLALKMKNMGGWTPSLEFYSGYSADELTPLMLKLNDIISTPVKNCKTIKTKYSHKIFFEVAKIPTLSKRRVSK